MSTLVKLLAYLILPTAALLWGDRLALGMLLGGTGWAALATVCKALRRV